MTGALAIFLYYVSWQRLIAWSTGISVLFLVVSPIVPAPAKFLLLLFSGVVGLGFPTILGSVAFRQLIGNRRFVVVPGFRVAAGVALLLLAIAGAFATLLIVYASNALTAQFTSIAMTKLALLSFSVISGYLLLSQWLVTYSLGLLAFAVLPVIPVRIATLSDPLLRAQLTQSWLLLALAILGWIWLFAAMFRPGRPRPMAMLRIGAGGTQQVDDRGAEYQWIPQWGPAATAAGTLTRGFRDGWRSRLAAALVFVLSFPLMGAIILFVMGVPLGDQERSRFSIAFFLIWSVFGLTLHSSLAFSEWPARLRLLWLRTAGDRTAGWRFLERMLVVDTLIIAAVAAGVALVFAAISDVAPILLWLYVSGSVVLVALGSYSGFYRRARNWHHVIHSVFMILLLMTCFGSVMVMARSEAPERMIWLVPILAGITVVVRMLARNAVARIDWCVVRPARKVRAAD